MYLYRHKALLCMLAATLAHVWCIAQDKGNAPPDTLALLREFVQVCNSYKTQPLHVQVEVESTGAQQAGGNGPTAFTVQFFAVPHGLYTKMNYMEQVADDSLVLMIDNAHKRMALYAANARLLRQMTAFTGLQAPDSSLQKLAGSFKTWQLKGDEKKGTSVIELDARTKMPGTDAPMQSVTISYGTKTKEPELVTVVQRQATPLDSLQYTMLVARYPPGRLVKTADSHFYLTKTTTVTYRYTLIEHPAALKLPLELGGCITKNAAGVYIPAGKYTGYALIKN